MKIGIAILNWNGINLLKSHLKGVIDKSGDSTIYIIDNNSDDNSVEFVEQNFPQVKLISLDKKRNDIISVEKNPGSVGLVFFGSKNS